MQIGRGWRPLWGLVMWMWVLPLTAQEPEEAARESLDSQGAVVVPAASTASAVTDAIRFAQVQAAPQDLALLLRYARERIAVGDLREGAATLERILLLAPGLASVRLTLGLVFYQQGLLERAQFEIQQALASGSLDPEQTQQAQHYAQRITQNLRSTQMSVLVSVGMDSDQNRNQAPASGTALFAGTPVVAPEAVDDTARMATLQFQLSHDLGTQAGHLLRAQANILHSDKQEFDALDLSVLALSGGAQFNLGAWSFSPMLRASEMRLESESYLQTVGAELGLDHQTQPTLRSYALLRWEDEQFSDLPSFQAAGIRSGARWTLRGGWDWALSQRQQAGLALTVMDKEGEVGFESYARQGLHLMHRWLAGRGVFTLAGLWAEYSDYAEADAFVSPDEVREDWLYRGRLVTGVPIHSLMPQLLSGSTWGDVNVLAQYEYERVDSNLPNFDYHTHKFSLMLSKRWAL